MPQPLKRTPEQGYRRRTQLHHQPPARQAWFAGKLRWLLAVVLFIPLLLHIQVLDKQVRTQFEGKRWALPARVYARPLEVYPTMRLNPGEFATELAALNYREANPLVEEGDYYKQGNDFYIKTRQFSFWDGQEPSREIRVRFKQEEGVTQLADLQNRQSLALLRLDPQLIGKIYPSHNEDRMLVQMGEIPPLLIKALTSIEDRNFYEHMGLSVRAIVRATLENFRAGEMVQGGSTLTQQLVKNYFLSPERTLKRKINEALMALLLEWHYEKDQILEAYLNEVYLGQDGSLSIHGIGLGSWFYFNRPVHQLKLPEIALLVGMARAASFYNPRKYPDRAWKRRSLVLDLMAQQGVISPAEAEDAKQAPLNVTPERPLSISPYPSFLELVRRQLREDYREEDLQSEGLQVFTTLDPFIQRQAEQSLTTQIKQLEKDNGLRNVQGSMVVTSTESGEVLGLLGGRNTRYDGFNRALDSQRPIGSIVKPAVYLAALERNREYSLTTALNDSPVEWKDKQTGRVWSPQNYDGKTHGPVALHTALANSYNLATVHLGLDLGLDSVRDVLRRLGIQREFPVYPSMLLGGISLSPIEVTQMYQTIACSGFRVPLRAIRNVLTHDGKPLNRYSLSVEQSFDAAPIFLLNHALQEAVRDGTGRRVAQTQLPPELVVAGKTGTTNNFRDSWFAGYSSDLLAVVWLGKDNNHTINLSGGDGAMRIWGDFIHAVHPKSLGDTLPERVQWRWVQTRAGKVKMPFIVGNAKPETTEIIDVEAFHESLFQGDE